MMMKPKDHDHDKTAPSERFSRLSLCKKQDKENQFPMTSSVCCSLIYHGQRPITARVAFTILYKKIMITEVMMV